MESPYHSLIGHTLLETKRGKSVRRKMLWYLSSDCGPATDICSLAKYLVGVDVTMLLLKVTPILVRASECEFANQGKTRSMIFVPLSAMSR
jgi:hypothetical protein